MSTDTVKLSTGQKGQKIAEAFDPFVNPLTEGIGELQRLEATEAGLKVRIGGTVAEAISAMMAVGSSAEEAQERILRTVGPDYKWPTVQAWTRAYTVAQTLPEPIREACLAGEAFGVDALQAIGRVPEKDDERATFAQSLSDSGTFGTYKVRDAVTAHKGQKAPKGTAEKAADIVKRVNGEKGEAYRGFVREASEAGLSEEKIVSLTLAAYTAMSGKDSEKWHRNAAEEIVSAVVAPERTEA